MEITFLALGSNLGKREENLNCALKELNANHIDVIKVATIIETKPEDGPKQNDFLNTVLKAKTALNPFELLKTIKFIENKLGRIKTIRNGPRIIDIDILLYVNKEIKSSQLTIPHPRMRERNFVLIPLKEIAPEFFEKDLCLKTNLKQLLPVT